MNKIILVFLLTIIQSIAFTQIVIDGNWYVYEKDNPAEINNYIKDSITHGYSQIDFALGFPKKFYLSRDKETYMIPEDELKCTEQLLFKSNQVQNMTECTGINDQSYWLNGGKNGVYEWIKKKTIRITYIVGLGEFVCVYKVKEKKNILTFVIQGNVEFTKLEE
jgi:hypothetical protein